MIDLTKKTGFTISRVSHALDFLRKAEFKAMAAPLSVRGAASPPMFGIWFRGQCGHEHLTPSVFREPYDELGLFTQFKDRAAAQDPRCRNSFEWLCLMRHFHLPARLLDWSESLLVALFFAVETSDAPLSYLFVLNGAKLNGLSFDMKTASDVGINSPDSPEVILRSLMSVCSSVEDLRLAVRAESGLPTERGSCHSLVEGLLYPKDDKHLITVIRYLARPCAVFPRRFDTRMALQQSTFTLHGGKVLAPGETPPRPLPAPESLHELGAALPDSHQYLIRVTVSDQQRIKAELMHLGIHIASLFPELDRQSNFLKEYWRFP